MKALVFHGDHDLRYEEIQVPKVGDQDALIRVKAVGICGSDVHGFEGKTGRRTPPMIMGHETSGIVEKVGGAVRNVKPGDRVVLFPYTTCGHCSYCKKGIINQCPDKWCLGVFSANGAMAEYVKLPAHLIYPLPETVDFIQGALVEPLSVSARAVKKAGIQPGHTVTIIGAGTIGLMGLILVKRKNPRKVVMVDLIDTRLHLARELGADLTFNAKEDPRSFIDCHLGGGSDIVIEAVGIEKTVRQSIQWAARGGKAVIVGLSQQFMSLDMHEIVNKEVNLEGSFLYDRKEFEEVLKELPSLKPSLDRMISLTAPLSEGIGLFHRLAAMDDTLLKVILTDKTS